MQGYALTKQILQKNGDAKMGFWIYMLFVASIIPLLMVGFGAYFRKNAPKEINPYFGYRTKRSMRNQKTWQYAHKHCGRLWFVIGLIMLLLSYALMVVMLLTLNRDSTTVGTYGGIICGIQCVILIASCFPTEFALKKKFDTEK